MGKKRNNHASNWSSKGGGLSKHRKSGHPHNHRVTIERGREENRRIEEETRIRRLRKGKMYGSIKELFGE